MTRANKKKWRDFSPGARAAIVTAGAVEVTLLVAALCDLRKRPAEQIRGRKGAWVAVSFINTIGPISYFLCGRKKQAE